MSYWLDEDESGKAKIKIWTDSTVDETPCAFCAANSARLSENDGTLRVWMPEQDLDGSPKSDGCAGIKKMVLFLINIQFSYRFPADSRRTFLQIY